MREKDKSKKIIVRKRETIGKINMERKKERRR